MRKTGQVIKKNEVSEQRDFFSTVTKQERDFESGVSVERPTRKVKEVVILNGKTYYIV
tara:strand:- start:1502 stop:1675 length:174 start_codon:yes stop_codon:yes gene_type:complete